MDDAKQKEAIDKILNEHNAEVAEAKKPDLENYVPKKDFEDLKAQSELLKAGQDKFKDYDELAKYKADSIAKETREKKFNAVEALLKANSCNEKVLKLLGKTVDLEKVTLDDSGGIVKGEELINSMKADNPDLFSTTTVTGTAPAKAVISPEATDITLDKVKSMSKDEINAHWAEVSKALQGK